MWRSLFWKEWREQRWKAAFNTLLVTAFVAIGLRMRISEDYRILVFGWALAALILPFFVSMGLVAAERAEGSSRFLQVLPSRFGQVISVKIMVGIIVVLLPFLCSFVATLLIAGGRETSVNESLRLALLGSWIAVQSLIWYLAFGITQPDEARAGLMSMAVIILWTFYTVSGMMAKLTNLLWLMPLPFGQFILQQAPGSTHPGMVVSCQILILLCLFCWILVSTCSRVEVKR